MLRTDYPKTLESRRSTLLTEEEPAADLVQEWDVEDADDDITAVTSIPRQLHFKRKNRRERILGALLLIPATPVICVCWALVRITSAGPGLFRQTRVGYLGREFQVLKLRTMRIDAEANGPQWSNSRDPRVTPLGRWYRKLHLDELPQLFNVVRGEMVLTGPRPERPEFVRLLSKEIPNYKQRLSVKPGITGLAQVNLPPDSDLESVEQKQTLDLHYIQIASFWLDQRLLASTAFRLMLIRGKKLNKLLGVDKQHLVENGTTVKNSGCKGSTMLSELLKQSPDQKKRQGINTDQGNEDHLEFEHESRKRAFRRPR